nr:MAG TPA_asm: hypothetical protein [Caudoviricetes sp.]
MHVHFPVHQNSTMCQVSMRPQMFFQVLKIDDYGTFGCQQRRYFIKSKILLHVVNITNKLFIRLYINILQ